MKVYIAGPDVFRKDAEGFFDDVRRMCADLGITPLIPIDNEVTMDQFGDKAAEIYKGNVRMIDECDVVLANITPFRGAHMDPGTAFEIGYAAAKGKTIYSYTPHAHDTLYGRVLEMGGLDAEDPKRDYEGNLVEDFGETENLMITVPSSCIFRTFTEALNAVKSNLGS